MSRPSYAAQHRGDATAYASYFSGMDKSMQQKVAYTTAHFPTRGVVADMGAGSGLGTYQLAQLHPHLSLVGVDINGVSVKYAADTYRLPNLKYVEGDIGVRLFDEGSLDGILNSSVLHHVTSFNGFNADKVREALRAQAAQLRDGGVIVIRDFVIGRGPPMVLLDLPTADGADAGEVAGLSTAALFEVFASGFRSSVNPDWPVPFARVQGAPAGSARFKLERRLAAEFLLRKDYRADWVTELLEEYTYFSQADFEEEFRGLGLRIVVSQEVHNPWIVANRFEGKVAWSALDGTRLAFPPTNYVIVGEKVGQRGGVQLREALQRRERETRFLSLQTFEHTETGARYELVRRSTKTLDVLPWFERDAQTLIVARQAFPRPILNARSGCTELQRISVSGHINEPVTAVASRGTGDDAIRSVLASRAGLTEIEEMSRPMHFFTSPGGANECVNARLVRIRNDFSARPTPNTTPFPSAGTLRELDPHQLLRASQVGGMFDARLEVLVYRLLRERGEKLQPWIGAQPELPQEGAVDVELAALDPLLRPPMKRSWRKVDATSNFLEIRSGEFVEETLEGETLGVARLEYVVPRSLSTNTVSVLPAMRIGSEVVVGLELRDLPAVGEFLDSSLIATCPAWRLPREIARLDLAERYVANKLQSDFGVEARRFWQLGGRYFPTAGVSPEVVYPYLCAVREKDAPSLNWVRLTELMKRIDEVRDGHLLIALNRAAHALA